MLTPPSDDERFDLITMGRVGVDLYPLEDNRSLKDVAIFGRYLGGSPTNVAVASARHGLRTAVITRTGDDPFSEFVTQELKRLGVDNRFVRPVAGARTTLAFCEIFPPDHFPLYFVRGAVAPELTISAEQLDLEAIAWSRGFWATATGLSAEPSRAAHHAAWDARARATSTMLDLDYREGYWPDEQTASLEIDRALEKVSVAVGNLEECRIAVGETDPERAADALLERGVTLAVVKMGPAGVLAKTADETLSVPPTPVAVVNGLGAGDGFGGALAAGLINGWGLERVITFASAAGAIVAGRRECSTAMPTSAEVESVLARGTA